MIPTVRLAVFAALGCLLALGVALEHVLDAGDNFLVPLLVFDGIVVGVAAADLFLGWRPRVTLARAIPQVLSVGRPNQASLEIRSQLNRRAFLEVTDDGADALEIQGLPSFLELAPGARATVRYHVVPLRRGSHAMGDLFVRVRTPLGLWRRELRIPAARTVRVYPDLEAVRVYEKLVRESRDERFTRATRRRGGESEFERLREYTRDDDVRRIDWKATARRRTVIAREYQLERNQNVLFLLDLGRLMTAETDGLSHLDHALNATLMLSHVSVRAGDHVGLAAFDEQLRTWVPPEGGPRALQKIVRTSYDLFPSLVEPDYRAVFAALKMRLRKRSLVVLFTQVLDQATQKQLVPLVKSLSPTHLPLCVVFRDEGIEDLVRPDRTTDLELYTRGPAAAELQWRERLVEDMRAAGALVLYVHPRELTQQLIARYLDVKARQLL